MTLPFFFEHAFVQELSELLRIYLTMSLLRSQLKECEKWRGSNPKNEMWKMYKTKSGEADSDEKRGFIL